MSAIVNFGSPGPQPMPAIVNFGLLGQFWFAKSKAHDPSSILSLQDHRTMSTIVRPAVCNLDLGSGLSKQLKNPCPNSKSHIDHRQTWFLQPWLGQIEKTSNKRIQKQHQNKARVATTSTTTTTATTTTTTTTTATLLRRYAWRLQFAMHVSRACGEAFPI